MLSLKTIILKYLLVCVFLVSPCCVHRDRRPDQTVSVVPSPRFDLFVFSSVLFVPVFCPSRQASPLAASPHARGSREFTPPFAALPSRGSRDFMPAVRGSLRRRSRLSHPAVRGSSRRRSRLSHPAVRGSWRRRSRLCHPAVRGSSRRRSRINQPSVHWRWRHHPRLTLARRPASDSMPAGLPLTQCPPACLWFQLARSAADSSSPDCRWLKLAGLPLTHATGRWQGKPIHFRSSRRRLRLTDPAVRGRSRRRPWGKPTHRRRLPLVSRGKPTRRPRFTRPAAGWGSLQPAGPCRCVVKPAGCCRYLSSQPVMVSPAGRCRIDKPAGRGRIWPDSDLGLFKYCVCVFSPGGLLVPLSCPMVIFWGGTKVPAVVAGPRDEATATMDHRALASWAPCSSLASVYLFHSGGPVLCMYPCLSWGASRVPTPPPRWNCYGSGRAFREGGSYVRVLSCASCDPASCFYIWFVSCNYEFIRSRCV